ncbi:MAG: hypothetical protein K0U16_07760 [Gammaproteobacteria bacterium]|nr:hypothetical protein [Gammaproteobacteria bacterium]
MSTYEEFAERHGITMTCEQVSTRPGAEDWPSGSSHWKCKLKRGRRTMTVLFSMGSAHTHTPRAYEVLQSVAMDAGTLESSEDYAGFLDEFGYDDDPQHRRTWKAIQKETKDLKRLLDDDELYEELLYETEEE